MLELGSLDEGTQALVLVGFSVVIAAALLLTLTGLNLPPVQLFELDDRPIRMALPFFWAVIFVFSIGWGYILAAVLGFSHWLRWPALSVFTVALLQPVVSALGDAQAQRIQLDALTVLQVAAPELALLVPVWSIAAFSAIAHRSGVTPPIVLAMIGSVLSFFAVFYLALRLLGETTQGTPVIAFMNMSLAFLLPLYLLAGVDLAELLFQTGVGAWSGTGPRLGRRAPLLLGLVAALSALAVVGLLDRGAFLRLGSLAYAAVWLVANLVFLRWVIPRVRIHEAASHPLLFLIVIVASFAGNGYVGLIPPLPGGVPAAISVTGAACLVAAAALSLRRERRLAGPILLVGVMGIWMLFSYLPSALRGIAISPGGLLGEIVVGSALALIAVTFAAEKYPALVLWRTVGTVWTLGIALMDTYRLVIVIRGVTLQEVLPALQVAVLLVALALVLVSIPLPVRIAGAAFALVGLLGAAVIALFGGPLRLAAIASATVLAVAVVWEVLMSGRRITNREGRLWPRESRVIGFLGYSLVGLAVALFAATAEGLPAEFLNPANFPAIGLVIFGVPTILYTLRAAWRPDHPSFDVLTEF